MANNNKSVLKSFTKYFTPEKILAKFDLVHMFIYIYKHEDYYLLDDQFSYVENTNPQSRNILEI